MKNLRQHCLQCFLLEFKIKKSCYWNFCQRDWLGPRIADGAAPDQLRVPLEKFSLIYRQFFYFHIVGDVDYEGEPWPVTDEEGYYQSYKDNGSAWVNWWHRSDFSIKMTKLPYLDLSLEPDWENCYSWAKFKIVLVLTEEAYSHGVLWTRDLGQPLSC